MGAENRTTALAAAIVDGEAIDWGAAESGAGSDDERAAIRRLQLVQKICLFHRALSTLPDASGARGAVVPFPAGGEPLPAPDGRESHWGRLELIELIGRGAYGDVYRARDPELDREVALKLLRGRPADAVSPAAVHEGRLLARVNHPNIATVFGAERIDGQVGVWMELVRGETLEAIVRDRGALGAREAALVGIDVCRALAAVHAAGLVHRDVKAHNVMREEGGRTVLLDFGTGHDQTALAEAAFPCLAGTPLYLAPEIFDGRPATAQSDIYSLGVLLYHLVTGGYPIFATGLGDIRRAHVGAAAARLRDARPDLPGGFVRVVDRALSAAPGDRFQTAAEMEAGLDATFAPVPESSEASHRVVGSVIGSLPQLWKRRQFRATMATAALAVMCLAIALASFGPWFGPAMPFAAREWVLVAAFENRTGERALDGSVEFAFQRELANSRFLNVVPPERVSDTLALMQQPSPVVLSAGLAREVCLRDGNVRGLITGRIDKFARTYVLGVQVIAPSDGHVVASLTEDVDGQAQILPAVRRASDRVRRLLGEQDDDIRAGRQRLERVTTPSLDALRLYSQAVQARSPGDWRASAVLAAAAIARDPNFASAEVWLAWALAYTGRGSQPAAPNLWSGRAEEAAPHFKRAFDLADTVSERERFFILGSYYHLGAPDLEKAIANYEALLRLYPDDYWGVNNLWLAYANAGRSPAVSFPLQMRLTELRPNSFSPFMVAVEGALAAGADRQTVQRLVEKGLALVPSDPAADPFPNQTAYLRTVPAFEAWAAGDGEAAGAMLDELRARLPAAGPARSAMQHHLADQYLALGRVREAEELYRNGGRLPGGSAYMPAVDLAAIALAKGDTRAFRRQARLMYEAVGADFAGDRADGLRTWFLARAGMRREAEHVAARALSENAVELAYVLGEVAAAQGKDAAAVEHLRTEFLRSPAFDSGLFGWWWRGHETIADALARSGDVAGAIRDLEAALAKAKNANPQTGSHGFWCVRARAKLAGLLRSAGRASDAETIERELRRLLVHADPDFEIAARLAQRQPAPSPVASAATARSAGARPASSALRRGPGAR